MVWSTVDVRKFATRFFVHSAVVWANQFPTVRRRSALTLGIGTKTLLLCATREESYIYGADRIILFNIVSLFRAFDF